MSKVSTRWLKHLKDAEAKEDFKRRVLNCNDIWEVLDTIVEEEMDASLKKMRGDTSFDAPAWSEKQAFELGFQKGLELIKGLITNH